MLQAQVAALSARVVRRLGRQVCASLPHTTLCRPFSCHEAHMLKLTPLSFPPQSEQDLVSAHTTADAVAASCSTTTVSSLTEHGSHVLAR